MVTNEDIMAELKKIRQEQVGFTDLVLSVSLTHATGGQLTVEQVLEKTRLMIDEKRVR